MPSPSLTNPEIERRVKVWEECGRNVSATSRRLGISRQAVRRTLRKAQDLGMVEELSLDPNVPQADEYRDAKARKVAAYQRKKQKGDWRKPVMCRLPDRPFRLKLFGDPHLDADGCNFELFERHWLEMDAARGVYGVCIGDWFNNWLRALAHLWKNETSRPSDAWTCLEYLMEARGDALIGACSGNHDDWSHGPADPVDLLMKKYGVIYRKGAVRIMMQCGDKPPIMAALRHKWQGKSMYSAAHWGVRANREGWRDHLLVGGHIHQDDARLVAHNDGFVSHICQISTFKEFDEYVDVHGFNGQRISPVWDLVIDPAEPDESPDKVKVFWSSEKAAEYLEAIR